MENEDGDGSEDSHDESEDDEGDDSSGSGSEPGTTLYDCGKMPPRVGSSSVQLVRGPRTRFSLSPFLLVTGSSW